MLLDKRGKNIVRHYLLRDKLIQNCLKIDATHLYGNDLLLKQETKKIAYPGSWYNNNEKTLDKRMHFYRTCSKLLPLRLSK